MVLRDVLESGAFAVTAELGPPVDPDPSSSGRRRERCAGAVDAANVTDNQAATVKLSPLACAVWMLEEGLEPIVQLTTRDRNLMALQSDLLGAWALGVRSILALSGDPLKVGPYEQLATRVGDLESNGLVELVAKLNAGELAAGETLGTPTGFLIGSAANPLVDPSSGSRPSSTAGAHCFQTNIVYDVDRFAEWFEPVVAAGIAERAPLLVGVDAAAQHTDAPAHARQHPRDRGRRRDLRAAWKGSRATRPRRPASRSPSTSSVVCAR